jgi:hypothetical protein
MATEIELKATPEGAHGMGAGPASVALDHRRATLIEAYILGIRADPEITPELLWRAKIIAGGIIAARDELKAPFPNGTPIPDTIADEMRAIGKLIYPESEKDSYLKIGQLAWSIAHIAPLATRDDIDKWFLSRVAMCGERLVISLSWPDNEERAVKHLIQNGIPVPEAHVHHLRAHGAKL